jgi:hypothetical protein
MHLSISDGTFIEWLHATGEYTEARHELYTQWKKLYRIFKTVEFNLLSTHTGTARTK